MSNFNEKYLECKLKFAIFKKKICYLVYNIMTNFYEKYIKYKLKFTILKKQLKGGNLVSTKLDYAEIEPFKLNLSNPLACNGTFCLYKENNIYSLIDTASSLNHSKFDILTWKNHFIYAQYIIKDYPKSIEKVCILGFGLGGIPLELSLNTNINQIDCVDINYGMFKLFKSIINKKPEKINLFLDDARIFVKNINELYDMVFDDTFANSKINFNYEEILPILKPGGILYINIHYLEEFDIENLKKNYSNVKINNAGYGFIIKCIK